MTAEGLNTELDVKVALLPHRGASEELLGQHHCAGHTGLTHLAVELGHAASLVYEDSHAVLAVLLLEPNTKVERALQRVSRYPLLLQRSIEDEPPFRPFPSSIPRARMTVSRGLELARLDQEFQGG